MTGWILQAYYSVRAPGSSLTVCATIAPTFTSIVWMSDRQKPLAYNLTTEATYYSRADAYGLGAAPKSTAIYGALFSAR